LLTQAARITVAEVVAQSRFTRHACDHVIGAFATSSAASIAAARTGGLRRARLTGVARRRSVTTRPDAVPSTAGRRLNRGVHGDVIRMPESAETVMPPNGCRWNNPLNAAAASGLSRRPAVPARRVRIAASDAGGPRAN